MNYRKTYNRLFSTCEYNSHTHREPRFLLAIHNLKKFNMGSLIDIGTGSGDILSIAHEVYPEAELTAVDLNNYHNLDYVTHVNADITRKKDRDRLMGRYDALSCLDCLEHIEEKHIDDILRLFLNLSDRFVFSVANHSDIINGVELHLTQRDSIWWINKLSKFFEINYFESFYENRMYFYKCWAKR